MNYTCENCAIQCMERSREYICSSFMLMDGTTKPNKSFRSNKSKSNRVKSGAPKNASEKLRKDIEK